MDRLSVRSEELFSNESEDSKSAEPAGLKKAKFPSSLAAMKMASRQNLNGMKMTAPKTPKGMRRRGRKNQKGMKLAARKNGTARKTTARKNQQELRRNKMKAKTMKAAPSKQSASRKKSAAHKKSAGKKIAAPNDPVGVQSSNRQNRAGMKMAAVKRPAGTKMATSKNIAGMGMAALKNPAGMKMATRKNIAGMGMAALKNPAGMKMATRKNIAGMGMAALKNPAGMKMATRKNPASMGMSRLKNQKGMKRAMRNKAKDEFGFDESDISLDFNVDEILPKGSGGTKAIQRRALNRSSLVNDARKEYLDMTGEAYPDIDFKLPSIDEFFEFVKKSFRNYQDDDEFACRLDIFRKNLMYAQAYKSKEQGSAEYGTTRFADFKPDEFKSFYANIGGEEKKVQVRKAKIPKKKAPKSVDWRKRGAVTKIKDQSSCGSCWAFTAAAVLEGHKFMQTGKLEDLSVQQLIDCDNSSKGCGGGYPTNALDYIRNAGGLVPESAYKYRNAKGNCQYDKSKAATTVKSFVTIDENEDNIAKYVTKYGPVAALVNADKMQYYKGGVAHFSDKACPNTKLNHAIVIVGFGEESKDGKKQPYWIIKNSWSTDWGEKGYWKLYKGKGVCGINKKVAAVSPE